MFGRFHRNVQGTFLELRKCPGFFNVPKQCSLNVLWDVPGTFKRNIGRTFRSDIQRIFKENVPGTFHRNIQRAFASKVRRTFRGNIQGTFAENVLEHSTGTFFENVPRIIFYSIEETFFIDNPTASNILMQGMFFINNFGH